VVGARATSVTVDGNPATHRPSAAALARSGEGWTQEGAILVISLSAAPVTQARTVTIK